jgi:hypothetical protein
MKNITNNNSTKHLELTLLLSLFSVVIIFAWGERVFAADNDSLFIDRKGNVGIGTNKPTTTLDVNGNIKAQALDIAKDTQVHGDLNASGTVKAEKFEGDGSLLKIGGNGNLKEALDKKFDNAGGTVSGPVTIKGKATASSFNICYCIQCKQDKTVGKLSCKRFGEWTEYSFPPKGNRHYESGCRIKIDACENIIVK